MGQVPQTYNNTLKAYGLVYTLVATYKIPVYWAIRPNKNFQNEVSKVDQIDFTLNGIDYRTGAFIIDADYATLPEVQSIISQWTTLYPTLQVNCNQPAFTAPIHEVLTSMPRAVLDAQNGGIIEDAFYNNTGLTNQIIGYNDPPTNDDPIYSLYRPDGYPSNLSSCDDIYAMPHADPHTWTDLDKETFYDFVVDNGGWIWLACHAPSSLETLVDVTSIPTGAPDMNFLSEEGLVLWGDHGDGTPPYSYSMDEGHYALETAADPFMQFIGNIDAALQSGSEQIYIPYAAGWRPTTTIAMWDPDHPERTGDGAYPLNAAALVAYGHAFGNPDYGMVVYEASHTVASGSEAENVGAARIYGNFWFQAGVEFRPTITPVTIPDGNIFAGQTVGYSISVTGRTPTFTYQWTSTCGGTFSNPNSPSTNFTPPIVNEDTKCIIRCIVSDECNRWNFLSEVVTLHPQADVQVTKTATPEPVIAGENITYTIAVKNNGPSIAKLVVVNDILPAGLTPVSATPTSGSWSAPNWTVGDLTNGQTATLTIVAKVDASAVYGSVLTNAATVTSTTYDPTTANNTATETTTVDTRADLSITKTSAPDPVIAGQNLTYTITVTNPGPSDAQTVSVADILPVGLTLVSATPSSGSWLAPNWTVGTLAAGSSVTMILVGNVNANVADGAVIANTATVTSTTTDPVPGNNTATETTDVDASADLSIAKSDSPDPVIAGQNLTYTIVVTNLGTSDAQNVLVSDPLPVGLSYVSNTGGGTYSASTVSWSLVTLAAGSSVTLTVTTKVNNDFGGNISNTATVSSTTTDPIPGNNTDTENTFVDGFPLANDDSNSTTEDTPVSGATAGNDTPSGDGGNVWSLVGPNGGAANGTVTMNPDGTYTYTPNANFNGTDVFTYEICDVDGDCDPATVTITITAVDDQPVANDDTNTTLEDTPVSGATAGNDTPSGDGGNVWSLVGPNGGAANGTVTMNPDGTYTYTPNANFNGTDVFTYEICDVDGDCDPATVTITITAVDDQPVANDDTNTTLEDTPVSGATAGNDTPSGDGGNVWSLVGPNGGAANGTVTMNPDGTYTYTPNANFNGTDVFTYEICDVDGDCDPATVTITITAVDDQPVANDDTNTTLEDTPVSGATAGNDTPSGDGGNVWSLVGPNGGAANGTVTMNPDGTYTYTPNANFNGTDVFTYEICDVDGDCDPATVTITITAVDDQPVANDDTNTTLEDTPVSGATAGNDTPSGDGGNVWSLVGPNGGAANGTVTMNPDGTYTYTPNANFNGTDVFTYEICDVDGDCDPATVTITITAVDDQPVANDDTNTTLEDTPVSGATAGNDTPSGDGGNVWSLDRRERRRSPRHGNDEP